MFRHSWLVVRGAVALFLLLPKYARFFVFCACLVAIGKVQITNATEQ